MSQAYSKLKKLGATFEWSSERECADALRNTSARIGEMSREYKADLTPWGGPQCYPQVTTCKKDNKKLLANSQVEQAKKRNVHVVAEGEARTTSGMPVHLREDLPGQQTECWLTCDVCGARRLVAKWCKLAVDSCGYGWDKAERGR